MKRDDRLLFGPGAALIFMIGIIVLPFLVPGYDSVRQTVSEIGETDSPMRWPFAVMLWLVALCLLVCAAGVWRQTRAAGHNTAAAYCIAWMAVAAAALGLFAFPNQLHNPFGQSELIGYHAPLAFALAWRRDPRMQGAVRFSWLFYGLVLISLALNLTVLVHDGAVWHAIRPVYGLVQRSLFACFFAWIAGLGWLLWRDAEPDRRRSEP
jgi:hypothetical membrane protein